jgi:outer membrane protein assembly factor BamE (lipoprotein component of BamABCDE complex)
MRRPTIDGTLLALLLAGVAPLASCNRPTTAQFDAVHRGMTEDEVRALLGNPSSTAQLPPSIAAQAGYVARWHYGDNLSSLATNAAFPDTPDSRVFVVFFDAEGRVVDSRAPTIEWQEAR